MPHLPTGTVTFLFTDVQGSTRRLHELGAGYVEVLAQHRRVLRVAFAAHNGVEIGTEGDSFFVAFARATDALAAAADGQLGLEGGPLQVRMGLHTGEPMLTTEGYAGMVVHRAARIAAAGHGGQLLLSQTVADLVAEHLPSEVALRDLGSVRLKDLASPDRIYQVLHPRLRADFPPLRSLEATPNNLPQQLTSFIGREQEIHAIRALLGKTRLLTLTGSGGAGKTRLSLQVAADTLEQFPDGAWFVELAPLSEPGLVPSAVASALGVKEETGQTITRTLVEHLKAKQLLLVLDNCEHMRDAAATLANALTSQCAGVKLLASSREPLGIAGEQTYRVPSLSLPDRNQTQTARTLSTYESVQLFIDRALLVRADFQVTNQNAPALASLCHHLDGIPLAIELAAARVRSLSIEEIDRRLDQRFRLLIGGSRTALPRHQTLRSLIDWSYDLLHEPEKLLLQRLSVFAGGGSYDAAEQVCAGEGVAAGEVLDLLTSLCDKSLVVAEQQGGYSRYRLLETMRQYAREKLEQSRSGEAIRERHRDYFLALAEEAEAKLFGAEQAQWLLRLEEEHENLRAGLEWGLVEPGSRGGLRLCGALKEFWDTRGHLAEGREWCSRMLGPAGTGERTPERAKALQAAGVLACYQGDYPDGRARFEESLAIRREVGDRKGVAQSLNQLGTLVSDQGDFVYGRTLLEESLAIRRELGDPWGIAFSLDTLGTAVCEEGDVDSGRVLLEESLAIRRDIGDRCSIARSLCNLGLVAGDMALARELHEESLVIFRELGDRNGIAYSLQGLARAAAALGDPLRAAPIWGAAERLRVDLGMPQTPRERTETDRQVAIARAALGDDAAFDHAWADGRALTLEQAIEFAMEKTGERG